MPRFTLQFPAAQVPELARRYRYPKDERPSLEAGSAAVERGFFTPDELETIVLWKVETGRTLHYLERNTDEDVTFATGEALAQTDERKRMDACCWLWGVDIPTASAILYFAFPERYPIIDFRALESLGVPKPRGYWLKLWEDYPEFCRQTAQELGVPIRTLDKALWQASDEGLV